MSDTPKPLVIDLMHALRESLKLHPSLPAGVDVSSSGPGDTSAEVLNDTSPPAPGDTSAEVLNDTSPPGPGDTSGGSTRHVAADDGDVSSSDRLTTRRACSADTSRLEPRQCEWCGNPFSVTPRSRNPRTCSKACRQAKSRFRVGGAARASDAPMRFGYADPPYPGMARRCYHSDEVDHAALVARLVDGYPDGWALSTSARALQTVLSLCPAGARVGVWVNGPRYVKAVRPLVAFEPVIFYGGRARRVAIVDPLCDVLICHDRQRSHPGALIGMKPAAFAEWMFRMLGAAQGDALDDLFPGSGAIGRAWQLFQRGGSGGAAETSRLDRAMRRTPTE